MRALIFAAGFGERMRPLTDHTPKPLLEAGGQPLIAWHLQRLAAAGVDEVAVNISHLAACFAPALGDGSRWGLRLHLLDEGPQPLETGGGMLHALDRLGEDPFIAVNGDIWTDFDFATLPHDPAGDAHLVLVDNPAHHPHGDFSLDADGRVRQREPRLTFAGIGVYRAALLQPWRSLFPEQRRHPPRFPLAPLLRAAIDAGRVSGVHHRGIWTDVGTPARLASLRTMLTPTQR